MGLHVPPSTQWRRLQAILGLGALAAWSVAAITAWPRFSAFGPICGAQDRLTVLGHCPSCLAAATFSLAFVAAGLLARSAAAIETRRATIAA